MHGPINIRFRRCIWSDSSFVVQNLWFTEMSRVKLFLSHWGKNISWGRLRIGCWGRYLDLKGKPKGKRILLRPSHSWKVKVKWSCYRPGVAQRMGRGIALLFHDCGIRRGWVVSSTPWPHFTPGKDPVPIVQEAGWAPGPVWMGRKISSPLGFDPGLSSL